MGEAEMTDRKDPGRVNDPNYDSGVLDYEDADLAQLVGDNCEAVLRAPKIGLRMESDSEVAHDLMWRVAVGCLGSA